MDYVRYFSEKLKSGEFSKLDDVQLAKLFNIVYLQGQVEHSNWVSSNYKWFYSQEPAFATRNSNINQKLMQLTDYKLPELLWDEMVRNSKK